MHCISARARRGAIVAAACLLPFAASAEEAADKSAYTLFNPTPADQMRGFATDRPNKSSTPYTVDAGHFQIESDLFNFSRTSLDGATSHTITTIAPTVKLGLDNRTDLEFVVPTYVWSRSTNNGVTQLLHGWTDLATRLKFNVWGNDAGDTALAIVPYVKWATGSKGVSSGATEGGVYVPLGVKFTDRFSAIFLAQADTMESSTPGAGKRLNLQGLANFSYALNDVLTVSAEYYWSHKFRDRAASVQTADLSVAWLVADDLQLDTAVYLPLNKAAPSVTAYFGIAKRF